MPVPAIHASAVMVQMAGTEAGHDGMLAGASVIARAGIIFFALLAFRFFEDAGVTAMARGLLTHSHDVSSAHRSDSTPGHAIAGSGGDGPG